MIQEYEKDENGRYNFPYKCPICGNDLSPEENIDVEFHNGKYRSSHVHPHDQLDHHCETPRVDNGICPGIWTPGGRRCEVFHDHILLYHVGLQILSLRISHPCPGIWSHGCLDRNVCGLDGTRNHIYMEIPQPQVVGA